MKSPEGPSGPVAPQQRSRRRSDRLEDRLRECEERYQNLTEHAKAGICIIQRRLILYANPRLADIFGYESGQMEGKPFTDFVHSDALRDMEENYRRFNSGEASDLEFETAGLHVSGRKIDIEVHLTMTRMNGVRSGLVLLYDVTARKRAEAHIHLLTQQLISAQENERARISRELHDRVAQDLSSLKIAVETIFEDNCPVPSTAAGRVQEISRMLQDMIATVRDLAYDLRPPGLDKIGLVRTAFQYCEDFQKRSGIRLDFHSAGMGDLSLDFDTIIHLYRLLQEALRNVEKHARASHVTVRMVASSPNVVLRIADNGDGFEVEQRLAAAFGEKRMGLRSMEERTRLIGGKLDIVSRKGLGTRVLIEAPCRKEAKT
jgi:PAS domain S-box-containing protein